MFKTSKDLLHYWVRAAMIAAIYVVITLIFAPISYGVIQVRISEMLMVLPYFTIAAVPGLFVGCMIANIFGGFGMLDIVFGSLATLISAYLVTKIKKKYLVPLPPVIINALIVGAVLSTVLEMPFYMTAIWVGVGQVIACYGLGYPLLLFLEKRDYIFK